MKKINLFLLVAVLLQSCSIISRSSGETYDKSNVQRVDFCDLEKYDGQLIRTKLIYSGVEEYWSGEGFTDCYLNHNVYINFDEYYYSWREIGLISLNRVHNYYWKKHAILDVTGVFEIAKDSSDMLSRFGHLGTCKTQITVKSVKINVKRNPIKRKS